jgi:ankyrin repeat protein
MAVTVELTAFNLNIDLPHNIGPLNWVDDPLLARSLLHQLAREGDILSIETLHLAGEKIDLPDEFGKRPLHEAAFFGHEQVVKYLASEGAVVDAQVPLTGETALLFAVQGRQHRVARFLIDRGAHIGAENSLNKNGLLHLAAENGDTVMTGMLIAAGINVFKENRYGQTARDIAAKHGHKELEKTLLKVMQHQARH